MSAPRLAVRALVVHRARLLLVNAYPGTRSDLWCAPGGGVETNASLPDNLAREIHEETGLVATIGPLAGVNEFHAPERGFHQVDLFFHATVASDAMPSGWCDPEGVVNRHRWVTRTELTGLRHKPDSLARMAWDGGSVPYDPLETIVG